jgi:hypothetical protein
MPTFGLLKAILSPTISSFITGATYLSINDACGIYNPSGIKFTPHQKASPLMGNKRMRFQFYIFDNLETAVFIKTL